jgi:GT2 family glycosyltransferase
MSRISVVIPSYNSARFLGAAIDSIAAQTRPPFEVIVVDDGSTDDTPRMLASLAASITTVIRQANQGPAAARNAGIAAATGDLIALLDADDIALPDRLRAQAAALEATPHLSVVASGYEWIDESGSPLPWPYLSWRHHPELNELRGWLFDCPIIPSATLFRRSAWDEVGGFDERLIGPEDWDFWMRLVLAGQKFAWEDSVVCRYRRLSSSLSSSALRMSQHSIRALENIISRPDFPPELGGDAARALASRHIDAAKRLFWSEAWTEGRVALERAVNLDPATLSGSPSRLEDELVAAAMDPLVRDPVAFLHLAVAHLPASAAPLQARSDALVARCLGEMFLRGVVRGDARALQRLRALPAPSSWVGDRGLWRGLGRAISNRARGPRQSIN